MIPTLCGEPFITSLTPIVFERNTQFLHISWKNEPPLSRQATLFNRSGGTIFRTVFSNKALVIVF
ncbi:hypothetical protein C7423_11516 [Pantoea ananatis]|nr:hypothetical protein C7426_101738 [Pantoea ananatis]REC89008.1 hypothetical protein C7423_11516 [Pantoea ananatis]